MKYDYKDTVKKDGTAQTNEDLFSESPNKGERFVFNNVSMEDETSACTYLRIGIDRSGEIVWLAEEKSPALGTLYWYDRDIYLYFGERVIVRFNTTGSGDRLSVYIVGFREDLPVK